jgi:hypothetical protein
MKADSPIKKRLLWLALFVGFFTFLALLSGVQSYVAQLVFDKPVPWSLALRRSFKGWYTSGVLSLGVLWFCRRNRLEPGRVGRWVSAHFGGLWSISQRTLSFRPGCWRGDLGPNGEIMTFSFLAKTGTPLHAHVPDDVLVRRFRTPGMALLPALPRA